MTRSQLREANAAAGGGGVAVVVVVITRSVL